MLRRRLIVIIIWLVSVVCYTNLALNLVDKRAWQGLDDMIGRHQTQVLMLVTLVVIVSLSFGVQLLIGHLLSLLVDRQVKPPYKWIILGKCLQFALDSLLILILPDRSQTLLPLINSSYIIYLCLLVTRLRWREWPRLSFIVPFVIDSLLALKG